MVTFATNIYTPLDREMLLLRFAAGSFHTKKLCSRLYSIKLEFYSQKFAFSATLGRVRVTYALHL